MFSCCEIVYTDNILIYFKSKEDGVDKINKHQGIKKVPEVCLLLSMLH